ncbi:hypothetical protein ERJ70_03765 [Sediminibacillus dalangtanensis]|uniref:Uncharacterized protein n=1 Tax=Sediminibacillus dalangtanensis TaxID=2729421 RepID=A0ABX7VSP4_9BACI|nr:hypothetical protein [Sediminibacillus dalangtanensis]QTM98488.1 hypothetical protein ERJ70_03765 [Sediminibacillus dalangtanensis]
MDKRIQALVDLTKEKFGLQNYYLGRHDLNRSVTIFKETNYTLTMEWFPAHAPKPGEDDLNPEGTAVIEIDIHQQVFISAIFVGGKSFAENGISFSSLSTDAVIGWVEKETGLVFGKQFSVQKTSRQEYRFQACVNGTAVSPGGQIEVKMDKKGQLLFFSITGDFPTTDVVEEAVYQLSLESIEPLAKKQAQLVEFPALEQEKLIPVYAMEEIYVKNDQTGTITFDIGTPSGTVETIDRPIVWDEQQVDSLNSFTPLNRGWQDKVTTDQAFSLEASPDVLPITLEQQAGCVEAVKQVLLQEYPDDSGKWIIKTIHRDNGKMVATLKSNNHTQRVFSRKLLVFIDADRLIPENYIDNQDLWEVFESWEVPESVTIPKEVAFEKIKGHVELEPVYVYDSSKNKYVLCGKLDCHHGVSAADGEVIALEDL